MELRYPQTIIIVIILTIVILLYNNKTNHKQKSFIANTKYIMNTKYYKTLIKKYYFLKHILIILYIISIITSTILISKPYKQKQTNHTDKRDIFICMDISSSIDELNLELIDSFKKNINKFKGDRIGISIFNTSSVTISPLTDDYQYINETLNEIQKSIKVNNPEIYGEYTKNNYLYYKNYITSGSINNYEERGTSLIGDGLISCINNVSNTNKERDKIIILTTDNEVLGTPLITLDEVINISNNKKVKIFGIGPKTIKEENEITLKNNIEKTNGKYYNQSNYSMKDIINKEQILNNNKKNIKYDIPEIPYIILLISIIGIIIISKEVSI